jgi:TonB family protein
MKRSHEKLQAVSSRTRRPMKISRAMMISLAGHILLIWLCSSGLSWSVQRPPDNVLRLELFGMIADRESAEQAAIIPIAQPVLPELEPEPEPIEAPEPVPEPVPEIPPPPEEVPLPNKKPEPKKKEPVRQPRPAPIEASAGQAGQEKRSLDGEREANLEKLYLAAAARAINSQLSYPRDARQKGLTGRPRVSFRVDQNGRIPAGSISLRGTSGHEALDQNALSAVAKVTLPPPPPGLAGKEITVTLGYNREKGPV